MKALVVYESMYGNTAAVARAIAEGIGSREAEVLIVGVDHASSADAMGCDLLVVGGPTHAHAMSRPATRKTALQDEKNTFDEPTKGTGIRGWIEGLHGDGRTAAAFDTRIDAPAAFTGAASKGIAKRLDGRGFRLAARESFLVTKQNTMVDGELERAAAWGANLAAQFVPA